MVTSSFDVDAATRAYLAAFNGAARLKSDAYFEGGYWLLLWGALVSIGVTWAILHFGYAARLSAWSRRVTGGRMFLATLLWVAVFTIATTLVELPWTMYTDFVREHQYGMSTQSFAAWLGDLAKNAAIGIPLTALLIAVIMIAVRRSPRRWWVYGGGIAVAFLALGVVVAPVLIEPLFNTYTPMPASPLREQILKIARGNGVPVTNVYVVDQSRQTTRVSANVAGLGSTARVALNDNLLATKDDAGILAVMGHETGHYALGHAVVLIIGFGALLVGGFVAVQAAVLALIRRYPRWGVESIGDPAAVAVAMIVITVYFLLITPLSNTLVRFQESQADIFGLNAARAPDGFARTAIRLGQYRKLEPTPFEEFVFFDHPSGYTRVHMAMAWKAEHLGEPGVR